MNDKTKWSSPQETNEVQRAFGGNMRELLPSYNEIPDEFKKWPGGKWNKVQQTWFFKGLPASTEFKVKDGIDLNTAIYHLAAIQGSYEPSHEHKEAAVAWLMSLWFDDVVIP